MVGISAQQVTIMFLLMLVGLLCQRIHFLHKQTITDLTNILLYIVSPALIVNSFQQKYTPARAAALWRLFAVGALIFVLFIVLAQLLFGRAKKRPGESAAAAGQRSCALRFGAAYTNAGFMGIPLAQAIIGSIGVFYAVPYVVLFNVFAWTHGVSMFRGEKRREALQGAAHGRHAAGGAERSEGEKKPGGGRGTGIGTSLRKILLNPNLIAAAVGVLTFTLRITFPPLLAQGIGYVASLTTPLSMIVIGASLAALRLPEDLRDREVWIGVAVRNLLLPLAAAVLLRFVPLGSTARMTTLILASCPVASMAVLFSVLEDFDTSFPTRYMCISTFFSILTMPVIIAFGTLLGL